MLVVQENIEVGVNLTALVEPVVVQAKWEMMV